MSNASKGSLKIENNEKMAKLRDEITALKGK